MLGEHIHDPQGLESAAGSSVGLGLLPLSTTLEPGKTLERITGYLLETGTPVSGYEIHCGASTLDTGGEPFIKLADGRYDGAVSPDGQVAGSYLHGLFDEPAACAALLQWAGLEDAEGIDRESLREREIDRVADCLEQHMNLQALFPREFAAA